LRMLSRRRVRREWNRQRRWASRRVPSRSAARA
jgi:hypothetical protein